MSTERLRPGLRGRPAAAAPAAAPGLALGALARSGRRHAGRHARAWWASARTATSSALGLQENEGYARLDARARVRVARGLEAFVVGENLLDREYQEALGYPALGRSVRAGLRFRTGQPVSRAGRCSPGAAARTAPGRCTSCARIRRWRWSGLLTTVNEAYDRVAMHAVRRTLLEAQARAAGLPAARRAHPLARARTRPTKRRWRRAVAARARGGVEAVAFGDLFLEDVRRYREQQMAGTGLEPALPALGPPDARRWRAEMIDGGLQRAAHLRRPAGAARVVRGARVRRALLGRPARRASIPAARTASSTPSPGTARCSASPVPVRAGRSRASATGSSSRTCCRRRACDGSRLACSSRPAGRAACASGARAARRRARVASLNLAADEVLVEILPARAAGRRSPRWADEPGTSNIVGRVPAAVSPLPQGGHGAAGGARARTWWSSPSTPTPTSCGCSSARACATTACRGSSTLAGIRAGDPGPRARRWARRRRPRGWWRATTRRCATLGAAAATARRGRASSTGPAAMTAGGGHRHRRAHRVRRARSTWGASWASTGIAPVRRRARVRGRPGRGAGRRAWPGVGALRDAPAACRSSRAVREGRDRRDAHASCWSR